MIPDSIIVYRNPIEQNLYECSIGGIPLLCWIVICAVVAIIGYWVVSSIVDACNRRRRNYLGWR